jgi:hypothetical protein
MTNLGAGEENRQLLGAGEENRQLLGAGEENRQRQMPMRGFFPFDFAQGQNDGGGLVSSRINLILTS